MKLSEYKEMVKLFNAGGVVEPTKEKEQAIEKLFEGITEIVPIAAIIDLTMPIMHKPQQLYTMLVGMYTAVQFAKNPGVELDDNNVSSEVAQKEIEELRRLFKK